jgi:hypothetical protein
MARGIRQQNIPRSANAAEKNSNPIAKGNLNVTNDGAIRQSKGKVYFNYSGGGEGSAIYLPVVVRDEYGNHMDLLRSEDREDVSDLGVYVNNQTIVDQPCYRVIQKDGKTERLEFKNTTSTVI